MFVESSVVTIMGLLAVTVLRRFEGKDDHLLHSRLTVTLAEQATDIIMIVSALNNLDANVSDGE